MATFRKKVGKEHRGGLKAMSTRPWKARMASSNVSVYKPIFRTMSVDDMLDLSSELTQYSRGLIEMSECSPLAKKCVRANFQRLGPKKSAEVVLKELNQRIARQNRIENAQETITVNVNDVHENKKNVVINPSMIGKRKRKND